MTSQVLKRFRSLQEFEQRVVGEIAVVSKDITKLGVPGGKGVGDIILDYKNLRIGLMDNREPGGLLVCDKFGNEVVYSVNSDGKLTLDTKTVVKSNAVVMK